MDWWNQFNQLQIDLTSHCNAKCPGCIRNINGGETIPNLDLNHLDKTLLKERLFSYIPNNKITEIKFNGNWGDCLMHPDFLEIIEDILSCGHDNNIFICTNGSLRTTDFFYNLAKTLRKFRTHRVQFAMDGLEDTHSLYRRNTSFKKLVENIQAFVRGGGRAEIVTTAFDYNIHQLDEIRDLARDIGCSTWQLRRSHSHNMTVYADTPYFISTDKSKDISGQRVKFETRRSKYSDNPLDVIQSREPEGHVCPWFDNGEIQIDPWGYVYPCCHMGHLGAYYNKKNVEIHEEELELFHDTDFNLENHNLKNFSIDQILNNYWFFKKLDSKLNSKPYIFCKQECNV